MHNPRGSITALLDSVALRDWDGAGVRLVALGETLAPDDQYSIDELIRDRRPCERLDDGLFLVGDPDQPFNAAATKAYDFIRRVSGVAPLVIVERAPIDVPTHVRVSNAGFAQVSIGGDTTTDTAAALVHEFAHCVAISGVGFLDEGFATLIERRFQRLPIEGEWWERPPLGALVEMDWTADPHFSALEAPDPDAPYRLGAWVVERLIAASGMATIIELFTLLRRRHRATRIDAVIERHCGVDLAALDAALRPAKDSAGIDAGRILAEGDVDAAFAALAELRAAVARFGSNAHDQLARAAITIGVTRFDSAGAIARSEARWAIKQIAGEETPQLLRAYRDVMDSFDATSPIERRSAGAKAVDRFATLIDARCDGESLIAAAKAQTYSPRPFLSVTEWNARLAALTGDARLGVAARCLIDHPQFKEECVTC